MTETFKTSINEICSYLAQGEAWHRRAANQCRSHNIRGWGRWHDAEAKDDSCCRSVLEKLLVDCLDYIPVIDTELIAQAESYMMAEADFKTKHHQEWAEREKHFVESLNMAIDEARSINMQIYCKLCELLKEVQNEIMRVEMTYGRLAMAGWNGHDIGVCSKWLHDYFEKEYDGGCIDFNIG